MHLGIRHGEGGASTMPSWGGAKERAVPPDSLRAGLPGQGGRGRCVRGRGCRIGAGLPGLRQKGVGLLGRWRAWSVL